MSLSSKLLESIGKNSVNEGFSILNHPDKDVSTSEVFMAFQEALEDKFGEIGNNGCSTSTGEWLSTESVLHLLSDVLIDL